VAVNDITDTPTLAHLLKYDSILGNLADEVKAEVRHHPGRGRHVKVSGHEGPGPAPLEVARRRIVIESTGLFTEAEKPGPPHGRAKKSSSPPPQERRPHDRHGATTTNTTPARHTNRLQRVGHHENCLAPWPRSCRITFDS